MAWQGRLAATAGDATRRVFVDGMADVAVQLRDAVASDLGNPTPATRRRLRLQVRSRVQRMLDDGIASLRDEAAQAAANGHKATGGALRRVGLAAGDVGELGAVNTAEAEALLRQAAERVEAEAVRAWRHATTADDAAAAQRVLDRFADGGLGARSRSGFRDLASYADGLAVDSARNASTRATFDRWTAAGGPPLLYVPVNTTSCPRCAPWQGVTVSVDGSRPEYPTLKEAEAAGLLHFHCRHTLTVPQLALVDDPTLTAPVPSLAGSDDERAQQRYLERGARRWRRRELVALDDAAAGRAAGRRRVWQARQREHVAASGARRDYGREQ